MLSFLGKPLTVWIVGELQSIVVYVGSVAANPVMRLALRLLADVDRISLADLERLVHRQHVTPQSDTFRAVSEGGPEGRQVSVYRCRVCHVIAHARADAERNLRRDGGLHRKERHGAIGRDRSPSARPLVGGVLVRAKGALGGVANYLSDHQHREASNHTGGHGTRCQQGRVPVEVVKRNTHIPQCQY